MATIPVQEAQVVEKTVLDNGVRIVSERMQHVRSISLGVWVGSGSRREAAEENGITHFVEHMVFKGTENRSAEEIARSVDSIGGHLDAFTSKETVCFSAKVLDEHLPQAFDVLGDLVLRPVFKEEELTRERNVILQEIKMDEDNPDYLVHEIFAQGFWQGHPLGRPILGTTATVSGFNRDKLLRYYGECFTPDNIVVAAAGNLEHERIVELVERYFGGLRSRQNGYHNEVPRPHAPITLHHKENLEQVQICWGVPSHSLLDDRRYAWSVLNTLMGGGMSSRLFQNIRERQGLCYAVFSDLSPYRDAGIFTVYAGTDREGLPKVVDSILHEFRDLQQNSVPAEELRRAKDNLKGSLMLGLESTGSRMSNLARQELYFGRYFSLNDMVERIEAVTPEQVREITSGIQPSQVALTVLGNVQGLSYGRQDLHW